MSEKQFVKFNLQDQSEVSTSDSTTPTPEPQQDWKEIPEFFEMKKAIACLYVELPESIADDVRDRFIKMTDAVDNFIQPLQSQNEALRNDLEVSKGVNDCLQSKNEEFQKEKERLENILLCNGKPYLTSLTILAKENYELKKSVKTLHELMVTGENRGIAKGREENEALQKEVDKWKEIAESYFESKASLQK